MSDMIMRYLHERKRSVEDSRGRRYTTHVVQEEATQRTEKRPVYRRESATQPIPLGFAVVGDSRIGVM